MNDRLIKKPKAPIIHPLVPLLLLGLACGIITVIARDRKPLSVTSLLHTRLRSLKLAFTTLPAPAIWQRCLGIALIYTVIAGLTGLLTGFLRPALVEGGRLKYVVVPLLLFIQPGLLEEAIFRGLLLPHPKEDVPRRPTLAGAAAGLIAFILFHPITGLTLARKARPLFTDLAFLFQAGLLGAACSMAYLVSGSIWPSVFIHWLPVSVWIMFFGGAERVARARWFTSL